MKLIQPLLLTAVLGFVPFVVAKANSIDFTSFSGLPATVDLNSGTVAFAYYADTGSYPFEAGDTGDADPINNSPTTDATNLGDFTAFTTNGGYPDVNPNGTSISYTGGAGGGNPATGSGLTDYDQIQSSFNGASFSLTSKLFASTETFQFYLINYSTASDLTASLNDAGGTTNSVTNKTLNGTDPTGGTAAVLTLTVTGDIGDTLTFTDTVDDSDPGTGQYGGITGLQAVTIEAPEPTTWTMLFGGAGLLILVARFRNKLSA